MAFHRFIQAAVDGQPVTVFGNGSQTRDFTFVSDIVDACVLAMDYSGEQSVFNVGGGTRITLNTVLDILADVLPDGVDAHYEDPAKGDVTHTFADISLARSELGYKPRIGVEEGIAREVEWLQTVVKRLEKDRGDKS
jgi:UDP-glucose 4-epimerase